MLKNIINSFYKEIIEINKNNEYNVSTSNSIDGDSSNTDYSSEDNNNEKRISEGPCKNEEPTEVKFGFFQDGTQMLVFPLCIYKKDDSGISYPIAIGQIASAIVERNDNDEYSMIDRKYECLIFLPFLEDSITGNWEKFITDNWEKFITGNREKFITGNREKFIKELQEIFITGNWEKFIKELWEIFIKTQGRDIPDDSPLINSRAIPYYISSNKEQKNQSEYQKYIKGLLLQERSALEASLLELLKEKDNDEKTKWLIRDGSIKYDIKNINKFPEKTLWVSKRWGMPEDIEENKSIRQLKDGEWSDSFDDNCNNQEFCRWWMRPREQFNTRTFDSNIIMCEVSRANKGAIGELCNSLCKNEMFPTCYEQDQRWERHIYGIHVAEIACKSLLYSKEVINHL